MCEFKPGDEVVCIRSEVRDSTGMAFPVLEKGSVYTVTDTAPYPGVRDDLSGYVVVFLAEAQNLCEASLCDIGFDPERFRKVQRRDLSAWLKTATKFEEPKRKKATLT